MNVSDRTASRAFAELESLSSEQCARFIARAKLRRGWRRWLPRLSFFVTVPIAIASFILFFSCFSGLIGGAMDAADAWMNSTFGGRVMLPELVFVTVTVLWIVGIPAAVCLLWRDGQIQAVLRDSIGAAECGACDHSLLGLPLLPDRPGPAVRCPECGEVVELAAIGLMPEDLIVAAQERTEAEGGVDADPIE